MKNMDIKDLNKSQLILLGVLLSFITSIATGITTVTLMQQAPASFTVPVNRVIKQTVEKIQQVEGKTTVQTIVAKEEDLVVDAIAKNKSAIFTVTKEALDPQNIMIEIPAGRAFAVSSEGVLVADATLVPDRGVYYVKNDSGKFKADFVFTDKKLMWKFLRGLVDTDGCVHWRRSYNSHYLSISWNTSSESFAHQIRKMLTILGFKPTFYQFINTRANNKAWKIQLQNMSDTSRFVKEIGFMNDKRWRDFSSNPNYTRYMDRAGYSSKTGFAC